jgi:thiol-disulfide isomerase/thioredoxin
MTDNKVDQAPSVLVACLCAQWCGVCRDYRSLFEQFEARHPHWRVLWIDVEDSAALLDPIEVENFPSMLIARAGVPLFFGTVLPQIETLERLLRASLADEGGAGLADPHVRALAIALQKPA